MQKYFMKKLNRFKNFKNKDMMLKSMNLLIGVSNNYKVFIIYILEFLNYRPKK